MTIASLVFFCDAVLVRVRSILIACALVLPLCAQAAGDSISRRDGFILMWQGIKRPAVETRGEPYTDVPLDSPGGLEINFAKRRQILEETPLFHPDAPLQLSDALLWLFRTRNIANPDDITTGTLLSFLEKYPLGSFMERDPNDETKTRVRDRALSQQELSDLIQKFDQLLRDEVHEVSLYGEDFQGRGTAFGETFDLHQLTAAHRTFPYNTLVKVTNVANNKSVIVRINDRGPYVKGRDMDLSVASFETIADRSLGKIHATFERLGDISLVGPCARQAAYQQRIYRRVVLARGVPEALELGKTLTLSAEQSFVVLTQTYPTGDSTFVQDWVLPGETFSFTPSTEGSYSFVFGTIDGHQKTMRMEVVKCSA